MRKIDEFSYICGIYDCFNEMVKAGLKPIALSEPYKSVQEAKEYVEFLEQLNIKYGTKYYLDEKPLVSDLFETSLTKDVVLFIFYRDEAVLEKYLQLKADKENYLKNGEYSQKRHDVALRFGTLLGYKNEDSEKYILNNNEKELSI